MPWAEIGVWVVMAAILVVVVFGWRSEFKFLRRMRQNRAAGVYDDPEFKRRIRPLNVLRYGLLGLQLLPAPLLVLLLALGFKSATVMYTLVAAECVVMIPALVVEHRWKKLMTEGIKPSH